MKVRINTFLKALFRLGRYTIKNSLFIAAITLIVSSQNVRAENDWRALCKGMASAAEGAMSSRQDGMAMSQVMEFADDNKTLQKITIEAYESPRYATDSMKARTIEEFRDKWYSACVKQYRPK